MPPSDQAGKNAPKLVEDTKAVFSGFTLHPSRSVTTKTENAMSEPKLNWSLVTEHVVNDAR